MPDFRPRIAIVGGGPSGLALGRLLHQRGIETTIYELRERATPEQLTKPSGMLDLHEESGLAAMRECGLWEGFEAAVGDCSEAMRVLNHNGDVLHTDEGELSTRPEIPRNSITSLLIQSIPSDRIKFEQKITSVQRRKNETTGASEVTLDLGANGSATYDFVIGADGAWSRVRKLLTDTVPFYSGEQYITATLRNASTSYPHLLKVSGTGALSAFGGCNAIMSHRGPQDSIRVYAAVSTPDQNWATTMEFQDKTAAEIKTKLLNDDSLFGQWAPELKDLLSTACEEDTKDNPGSPADINPMYMLPVGHRWEHRPDAGATIIGDAAHLMTPWAGEGVNLALWDALDLAHVLAGVPEAADAAEWQAALAPRVREFEEAMFARAEEKAEETWQNRNMFLSENGAQAMADFFKMAYAEVQAAEGGKEG